MYKRQVDEKLTPYGFALNTVGELLQVMEREMFLIDASAGAMLWIQSELEKL